MEGKRQQGREEEIKLTHKPWPALPSNEPLSTSLRGGGWKKPPAHIVMTSHLIIWNYFWRSLFSPLFFFSSSSNMFHMVKMLQDVKRGHSWPSWSASSASRLGDLIQPKPGLMRAVGWVTFLDKHLMCLRGSGPSIRDACNCRCVQTAASCVHVGSTFPPWSCGFALIKACQVLWLVWGALMAWARQGPGVGLCLPWAPFLFSPLCLVSVSLTGFLVLLVVPVSQSGLSFCFFVFVSLLISTLHLLQGANSFSFKTEHKLYGIHRLLQSLVGNTFSLLETSSHSVSHSPNDTLLKFLLLSSLGTICRIS